MGDDVVCTRQFGRGGAGLVGVRKQASGAPVERNPNEMVIRGTVALLPEVTPFPGFKKGKTENEEAKFAPH